MEAVETFTVEKDGATAHVSIYYDQDATSPDDWDNLGTFTHWHRGYTFGDPATNGAKEALERGGPRLLKRYLELVEHACAVVPVGMIDHSGISLYAGGGSHACDPGGWDSGTVGFMWTTHQRVNELCGEDAKYHTPEWIEEALAGEIKVWDQYVSGDVYGYDAESGDEEDSCWGIYGFEYAKEEARLAGEAVAETRAEKDKREAIERDRAAHEDIATLERTP